MAAREGPSEVGLGRDAHSFWFEDDANGDRICAARADGLCGGFAVKDNALGIAGDRRFAFELAREVESDVILAGLLSFMEFDCRGVEGHSARNFQENRLAQILVGIPQDSQGFVSFEDDDEVGERLGLQRRHGGRWFEELPQALLRQPDRL